MTSELSAPVVLVGTGFDKLDERGELEEVSGEHQGERTDQAQ